MGWWFFCLAVFLYVAAVAVLFRWPSLWHAPHAPLHFDFRHLAHRGGSLEAPENTVAAFRHAVSHGAALELDVWLSADGRIVVSHDDCLARVSRGESQARVSQSTWEELAGVRVYAPEPSERWEPLALLEEVLDACPGAPVSLDLKQPGDALIHEVYRVFSQRRRTHLFAWGSFREATRLRALRLYPDVVTMGSMGGIARYFFGFLLGGYSVYAREPLPRIFCLPIFRLEHMRLLMPRPWVRPLDKLLLWSLTTLFHSPLLLRHLSRRGVHTVFWTCNSKEDLRVCRRSSVAGIITDAPSRIKL